MPLSMAHKARTVYVGLSGGVDSSVTALRLKKAGYNVVGVFIKVWQPDFLLCNWEQERLDAMRVAATLGIPFRTFDAEEVYKRDVADYMIDAYSKGLTPNPDVMCNKMVKFGSFLEYALASGADGIATGHYAQKHSDKGTHYVLRGLDREKDQSYFLWSLSQEHLEYVHFPIGNTRKEDIRREALSHNLPTAAKKDSQGICFLGHINIQDFLSHYVDTEEGDVLDEGGMVIGTHKGALFYTIGQRHGFTITLPSQQRAPYYVIKKDLTHNTIVVSHTKPQANNGTLEITSLNWISDIPQEGSYYSIQTRYRQLPVRAQLVTRKRDCAILKVAEPLDTPALGQSCVLYEDAVCYGGGIIRRLNTE